jgi:hypothetical protein
VGFAVNKVTLEQVLLQVLGFSLVIIIALVLHTH